MKILIQTLTAAALAAILIALAALLAGGDITTKEDALEKIGRYIQRVYNSGNETRYNSTN